ncbi:hypothetical protein CHU92_02015 [Flavobacterium cyanobacteriorum]|uniref:Uncharacterized protein n=1 Tax=Flavobacterium cyanobacteriorum TaxID=2022802 RepID=A0A255ZV49_9FLAO|nr:hypothetical protein [Flavobacterium cyanobacteriorum]OYQ45378.1 hypothetical protein CHU92_02015 [Flavobacterium cyanobacteriorum]
MKLHYYLVLLFTLLMQAQEKETFSWDAATVNGKLNLTLPKREFDAVYKKADSIVAPRPAETCGTEEELQAKFLHYKGVKFELDNGMLNFRSIDFRKKKGMYMLYKGTKFNENYTLDAFTSQFPIAAAALVNKSDTHVATLKPDEAESSFEWKFYFSKGKLQIIECRFPCD